MIIIINFIFIVFIIFEEHTIFELRKVGGKTMREAPNSGNSLYK
jgi:hypothetical protein